MISRELEHRILDKLMHSNKVVIVYGARQVGKTTLSDEILREMKGKILRINADQQLHHDVLSSRDLSKLKGLVSGYDVLFIDEAQRIPDIGINLKIMHDEIPDLRILVTGSSSLDLANRIKEPLTGRTWTFKLYPVSIGELQKHMGLNNFEMQLKLEEWMRYGLYPELLQLENYDEKRIYLDEITNSYLYKDILTLANIRYPEKLRHLLKLLAFQIGNLISIHELAINLQVNRDTVINYLDLLEKSFVIFRLRGLSRNLRKEITSMDKIYFFDLGVRNSIIENFNQLNFRTDLGALWENFLIVERIKRNEYQKSFANTYFWRTHTGAELDYVEEKDGLLSGYEFKWNSRKQAAPKTWMDTYANSTFKVVDRSNFVDFLA